MRHYQKQTMDVSDGSDFDSVRSDCDGNDSSDNSLRGGADNPPVNEMIVQAMFSDDDDDPGDGFAGFAADWIESGVLGKPTRDRRSR